MSHKSSHQGIHSHHPSHKGAAHSAKEKFNHAKIIIEGITEEGQVLRPSDWAERLSGALSTFKNHRIYYSPLLKPILDNEKKCLLLDKSLKNSHPELYEHIMDFARKNKLKICGEEEPQTNK